MKFHALALICQFNVNQCIVNEPETSPFTTMEECQKELVASNENFEKAIKQVQVFAASCIELPDGYDLEKNAQKLKDMLLNRSKGDPA